MSDLNKVIEYDGLLLLTSALVESGMGWNPRVLA